MVTNHQDQGGKFSHHRGIQVMRKEQRFPWFGGSGRGVRGDRNLDNNSWFFWQARLSIDSCVLVRFSNFWFSTLPLFNECVQSCMNFKVMTCNYCYRRLISLSYDIWHFPSFELVYDIIRVEKVSTFFFCWVYIWVQLNLGITSMLGPFSFPCYITSFHCTSRVATA